MPPFDVLRVRIRGEYREMPGLQLTVPQACCSPPDAGGSAVLVLYLHHGFLSFLAD
jgi:hypothetical protein